jgi:hypothetical protein
LPAETLAYLPIVLQGVWDDEEIDHGKDGSIIGRHSSAPQLKHREESAAGGDERMRIPCIIHHRIYDKQDPLRLFRAFAERESQERVW